MKQLRKDRMKIASLIFLSMNALSAGCQTVSDIKFTTGTRGYTKEIVITPQTVTLHEENLREPAKSKDKTRELQSGEWNQLLKSMDGLALREIPLLKSPTEKHIYDGAMIFSLTITDKSGKVWSHTFDNEDPNQQLKPLLALIFTITEGN